MVVTNKRADLAATAATSQLVITIQNPQQYPKLNNTVNVSAAINSSTSLQQVFAKSNVTVSSVVASKGIVFNMLFCYTTHKTKIIAIIQNITIIILVLLSILQFLLVVFHITNISLVTTPISSSTATTTTTTNSNNSDDKLVNSGNKHIFSLYIAVVIVLMLIML